MEKQNNTHQLISEVARIIGLPIIPMAPSGIHDSKPFPHLVQHEDGRLFLDGQLFDPLANPAHFHLVEAWLERGKQAYQHTFTPQYNSHMFQFDDGPTFIFATRPLAGCLALVYQFGDRTLEQRYCREVVLKGLIIA